MREYRQMTEFSHGLFSPRTVVEIQRYHWWFSLSNERRF
jgi:hypothetical protein